MNTSSLKLSNDFIKFSEKLQTNRVKSDTDLKNIGHPKVSQLIVKFFKYNNYAYLELIKMEGSNHA